MKMTNIFGSRKFGLTQKIFTGALILGAVAAFYFNFKNADVKTQSVARATYASEEAFRSVSVNKKWALIGDEFTRQEKSITLTVRIAESFLIGTPDPSVTYKITGTNATGSMSASAANKFEFSANIDAGTLKPGKYSVIVEIQTEKAQATSQSVEFNVSYPLYVAWTLDWEGYDISNENLAAIDEIADKHAIAVTHFFNPRIYTSPAISKSRADYLTSWVIERKNTRQDAIGLHLHMFPDLVKAAGVEPRFKPAWGSSLKDGYDILTSAYTYGETVKMLNWSKNIFEEKGLGTPNMFRAGGWYADKETLNALDDSGFALDSSGRTKYNFGTNAVKGPWDLTATTRPYHPNIYDQNSSNSPAFGLWEFPDNGADSWAYSQEELYQRFTANFNGDPMGEKQIVTYLSHPEWFAKDNPKIKGLFTQIDKYLNARDSGPVIYITLEEAYRIWAGL